MLATIENLHVLRKSKEEKMTDNHDPYTERLHLRLTVEEKKMLQDKAAEANMKVSDYIRALVNNKRIVVAPDLPKLVVQIIKINTNVCQVLSVAKDSGTVSEERIQEIQNRMSNIQDLTGDLIKEVHYRKDKTRYKI
jgi:uncharacterized protein (DUF1778 family)